MGNALTVRNGNISVPNSSVPSFAISGGIGHDFMLFERQDVRSTAPVNFYDMAFNIYGTVNFLADNIMYKWYGAKNGVSAYWDILSFNPGVYLVSITGRWKDIDNYFSLGFDTDRDGDVSFPNEFEEKPNSIFGFTSGDFNYSFIYKVQSVQNFNIIARNRLTVYTYKGLGSFQLLFERIGFLKNNEVSPQSVSQQPATNNYITGSTNDIIAGSVAGTNKSKPTDVDQYINLNESGAVWIYCIDPTGALFNT